MSNKFGLGKAVGATAYRSWQTPIVDLQIQLPLHVSLQLSCPAEKLSKLLNSQLRISCCNPQYCVPVAPERNWKWGGTGSGAKVGGTDWSWPSTFLALKVPLVVLVSAFVMVSIVWSVSCLLFFYSWCPCFPAICKSWARAPPCPMESAPLLRAELGPLFHSAPDYILNLLNADDLLWW